MEVERSIAKNGLKKLLRGEDAGNGNGGRAAQLSVAARWITRSKRGAVVAG